MNRRKAIGALIAGTATATALPSGRSLAEVKPREAHVAFIVERLRESIERRIDATFPYEGVQPSFVYYWNSKPDLAKAVEEEVTRLFTYRKFQRYAERGQFLDHEGRLHPELQDQILHLFPFVPDLQGSELFAAFAALAPKSET